MQPTDCHEATQVFLYLKSLHNFQFLVTICKKNYLHSLNPSLSTRTTFITQTTRYSAACQFLHFHQISGISSNVLTKKIKLYLISSQLWYLSTNSLHSLHDSYRESYNNQSHHSLPNLNEIICPSAFIFLHLEFICLGLTRNNRFN